HGHHPYLLSFPTRRSSDLWQFALDAPLEFGFRVWRQRVEFLVPGLARVFRAPAGLPPRLQNVVRDDERLIRPAELFAGALDLVGDRKSTRLNSSHVKISYA